MRKALVIFAATLGAFVPGAFAYAETLNTLYSGSGKSSANTTVYCHETNDGSGCDIYNGANVWLTFDEPSGSGGTDLTLYLGGADECNAGGTNIRVYVMSRSLEGNANSTWTQAVNGVTNWSTPGGDLSGSYVGSFTCSTSPQTIDLTVPEGEMDAFYEFHSLALVGTENYPNFAAWYEGPDIRGDTTVTISGGSSTSSLGGFSWGCPEENPDCLVSQWSYLTAVTSTISEEYMATSSAIFGPYLHTVLGESTSTIPGCYITTAGETLDTMIGLVSGNPDGTQGNAWDITIGGNDFSIDFRPFRASFPEWLNDFIEFERTVTAFALWGMAAFAMWRDWIGGDEHSSNA